MPSCHYAWYVPWVLAGGFGIWLTMFWIILSRDAKHAERSLDIREREISLAEAAQAEAPHHPT